MHNQKINASQGAEQRKNLNYVKKFGGLKPTR